MSQSRISTILFHGIVFLGIISIIALTGFQAFAGPSISNPSGIGSGYGYGLDGSSAAGGASAESAYTDAIHELNGEIISLRSDVIGLERELREEMRKPDRNQEAIAKLDKEIAYKRQDLQGKLDERNAQQQDRLQQAAQELQNNPQAMAALQQALGGQQGAGQGKGGGNDSGQGGGGDDMLGKIAKVLPAIAGIAGLGLAAKALGGNASEDDEAETPEMAAAAPEESKELCYKSKEIDEKHRTDGFSCDKTEELIAEGVVVDSIVREIGVQAVKDTAAESVTALNGGNLAAGLDKAVGAAASAVENNQKRALLNKAIGIGILDRAITHKTSGLEFQEGASEPKEGYGEADYKRAKEEQHKYQVKAATAAMARAMHAQAAANDAELAEADRQNVSDSAQDIIALADENGADSNAAMAVAPLQPGNNK